MESIPTEDNVFIVDACQTRAMIEWVRQLVNEHDTHMAPALDQTCVGMQVISFS